MDKEERFTYICDTEWDHKKNAKTPDKFTYGSGIKVWWKCKNDPCGCHNWEATICSRVRGSNCVYCSNKKLCDHNNLLFTHPILCEEWDYQQNNEPPNVYSKGSDKKVWWKCKNDPCGCHTWEASIYNRTGKKPTNCPYCNNNRLCKHNNLLISDPDLCEEWDYDNNDKPPSDYTTFSNVIVAWVCKNNTCGCHKWKCSISNRVAGNGCPYCSNKKLCAHNNLSYTHPELCEEWDYNKNSGGPEMRFSGARESVWWICKNDPCGCHNWKTSIEKRVKYLTGCPYCYGFQICDHNNLYVSYKKICKEWDYKKNSSHPSTYWKHSCKKVWWKCKNDPCGCHNWQATIVSRTGDKRSGCPYCCNHILCSHNNLLILRPIICKEWDYNTNTELPTAYSVCSSKKVWWICDKNHKWRTAINTRTNGSGCPYCCITVVSKKQLQWIERITELYDIDIQSAANTGEHKVSIPNGGYYSLDGFTEYKNQKYAFEFDGCFWHGCIDCYRSTDTNKILNKTYGHLYRKTMRKQEYLKKLGYIVITMKECEYDDSTYEGDEILDKYFGL